MLRLGMLFVFSDIFDFVNAESIHGSDAYDEYALNLLETGVYGRTAGIPDAAIPPMYSYVLAGVYALFGRGFVQLGLFHILLDILSITLVYDICRRLFREEKNALGFADWALGWSFSWSDDCLLSLSHFPEFNAD